MKHLGRILSILLAGALFAAVIFEEKEHDSRPAPSVHIQSAQADRQEDGTYQVRVMFTTDAVLSHKEELQVWLFCGEDSQCFSLTAETAKEVHCADFVQEDQPEEVRAVIERDDYVPLLVDASLPVDGDRILILQEMSPGRQYEIRLVAELWEVLSCPLALSPDPREAILHPESPGGTFAADSDGTAVFNLTQAGLPDGLYLLTGEGMTQYICLPRVDVTGELLSSSVTVFGDLKK